jgi:DNA-binding transcriptional ArsR family regulator
MKTPIDSERACAGKLAALADPTRLAVIEILLGGPSNVTDMNRHLQLAPNLLSHHLRVLRDARLVISWRDGKGVRYALSPDVKVRSRQGIDLGCCRLSFAQSPAGKTEP